MSDQVEEQTAQPERKYLRRHQPVMTPDGPGLVDARLAYAKDKAGDGDQYLVRFDRAQFTVEQWSKLAIQNSPVTFKGYPLSSLQLIAKLPDPLDARKAAAKPVVKPEPEVEETQEAEPTEEPEVEEPAPKVAPKIATRPAIVITTAKKADSNPPSPKPEPAPEVPSPVKPILDVSNRTHARTEAPKPKPTDARQIGGVGVELGQVWKSNRAGSACEYSIHRIDEATGEICLKDTASPYTRIIRAEKLLQFYTLVVK